jgi:protein-tyrosine phosphatase
MTGQFKVLFVCAMNKKRSPTAEQIYKNDARLEVRSAGVRSEAKRRISEQDLKWADVVFVMERTHKTWIKSRFEGVDLPRIEVLEIPDDFEFMDSELQEMLKSMLDPEIDSLLSQDRSAA